MEEQLCLGPLRRQELEMAAPSAQAEQLRPARPGPHAHKRQPHSPDQDLTGRRVISAVAFRSQLQHCCSELRRFSIGTFALSRTRDEARWKSSYAWDRCDDKSWKWPPLQLKPSSCVLLGKACMHTRVSNTLEIRI